MLVLETTGLMVSAVVLGLRSRGSVSVLDRCESTGWLRFTASKCDLSRWSTVREDRRRGTLTWAEDPRGEYVAGGGLFSGFGSCVVAAEFSFSFSFPLSRSA